MHIYNIETIQVSIIQKYIIYDLEDNKIIICKTNNSQIILMGLTTRWWSSNLYWMKNCRVGLSQR